MTRTPSSSPPLFSPVPSPPPPSPTSPPASRPAPPSVRRRNSKRAVFDLVSTSPQAFPDQAESNLKERLERSRKLRIAVKPGVPAGLLSEQDVETSTGSSGAERDDPESTSKVQGQEAQGEDSSSPWTTDSDPPSRTTSPSTRRKKAHPQALEEKAKKEDPKPPPESVKTRRERVRIEGFEVLNSPQPPPLLRSISSFTRPPLSRSANTSTSSLSLMFARPPSSNPLVPSDAPPNPPTSQENEDIVQPPSTKAPGRTWNGEIVAETLASHSRGVTPSTSPRARQSSVPSSTSRFASPQSTQPLSTSASLPSLTRASSLKRTRFLAPSPSLAPTPSSSPPRTLETLQFSRRPTCTRQRSMGEGWSQFGRGRQERVSAGRGLAAFSKIEAGSDSEETEVEEESQCEELVYNRFRESLPLAILRKWALSDFGTAEPSIFASHYSNSATSLSSASSSTLLATSSISSSPKSTKSFQVATSVPTVPVSQPPEGPARRVSSEPKRVNLQDLRRQQQERRKKSTTEESEASAGTASRPPAQQRRRPSTTSPVSPTSMPHLQLPWKKLFSLS
ncbi:hypothetical protein JCM16303_005725 [Sporobolomyces ruberrimus]